MVNITNPIYTSVSDNCYYCHLTDTGVWLCEGVNVWGGVIGAFWLGIAIGATLTFVLFLLAANEDG